tara:strand:+ start:225 stop:1244 length:1020 start_codon:yes stop_codon:yes gene_type:complete
MVKYECYRCGYTNVNKSNIIRHINRKKTCKIINSNINLDDCKDYILSGMSYKDYCEKILYPNYSKNDPNHSINDPNRSKNDPIKCQFCERVYSNKSNLNKHLKICKEKKKDDTVKESMTELARLLNEKEKQLKDNEKEKDRQLAKMLSEKDKILAEELKKRDKQIEELIKKAGIVNTNNITNNIQNNFKLLNYKETDTSHLTENDYVRCLEHYNFCVPHLIRKIHFNPKKPENHNIYISNLKNSYVMIYMNNKWKVKNRDETISRVIDDKQIILEKKIQEWVQSGKQYPKVMAKFSRYIEKREENDVINAIKEDIKLMLYNNRNMIIENNKKLLKYDKK